MTGFPPGLLLITDRAAARHPLPDTAAAALDAGFAAVMLREKDLPGGALLELAAPLAGVCAERGRPLLVNDRVDVALALPGAGAHVGVDSLPVAEARALLGADRLLGYSAHDVEEARAALAAGADYVTLGPPFPSISKPGLAPRGVEILREAVRRVPAERLIALGGITAPRLALVRATGVGGAAVMGAVMRADDPAAAAAALVRAWMDEP